jgi:hypothetical protein
MVPRQVTRNEAIQEVLAKYPHWYSVPDAKGTCLYGPLVRETRSGHEFRFDMKVVVPWDFPSPDAHPTVRILKHNLGIPLGRDAHIYEDGTLCVQMPERHEINYREVGLVGFLQQVLLHLDRARIWAFTGQYPGEEYAHGEDGKREYEQEYAKGQEAIATRLPVTLRHLVNLRVPLLENRAWCPCGSGKRFSACHKPDVTAARREVLALGDAPKRELPKMRRNPFLLFKRRR